MTDNSTPTTAHSPTQDLDQEALREKYRYERDRRMRPDGATQCRGASGDFGYYAKIRIRGALSVIREWPLLRP